MWLVYYYYFTTILLQFVVSQQCGGVLRSMELELKSPGYPRILPSNAQCDWLILPVSDQVCKLEVEFLLADLHDSVLIIAGVPISGSVAGLRTFLIYNDTIVSFRSGKNQGKGFYLKIKQKKCDDMPTICGTQLNSQEVIISSPNNTIKECSYNIKQIDSNFCKVEINFQEFSLNCENGGIKIGDYILCGKVEDHKMYNFINGGLQLKYYTNNEINNNNFLLNLKQINCSHSITSLDKLEDFNVTESNNPKQFLFNFTPPRSAIFYNNNYGSCCNQIHSERQFILATPGFPYSNNIDCTYTIQRYNPEIKFLKLIFRYFWIGDKDNYNNCYGGFLEINGNLFCGCQTGLTWTTFFSYYDYSDYKNLHLVIKQAQQNRLIGFVIEVIQYEGLPPNRYKRQLKLNVTEFITNKSNISSRINFQNSNYSAEKNISKVNNKLLTKANTGNNFTSNRNAKIQQFGNLGILPDFYCLTWSIKDWIILLQQALWAQLHCPINGPSHQISKLLLPPESPSAQLRDDECSDVLLEQGWVKIGEHDILNSKEKCVRFHQAFGQCYLELTFHGMNTQFTPTCTFDHISISGIGNICYTSPDQTVTANFQKGSTEIKIRKYDNFKEIQFEFKQLPCSTYH